MINNSVAIRLVCFVILLSTLACGKSPWANYIKENSLRPQTAKPGVDCPLLDANQLQWIRGPVVSEESEFQINFREKPEFNLKIELYMPEMGHGSSPVQIISQDDTRFIVKRVYFIMHGLWNIRIKDDRNILCSFAIDLP